MKIIFLVSLRSIIGLLFIFAGLSKLLRPIEYFSIALMQYQIIPNFLLSPLSLAVPWMELILGTYLILGLAQKWAIPGLAILTLIFQLIIGQAILRGVYFEDCGCFGGGLITLSPFQSFIMASIIGFTLIQLVRYKNELPGLDKYFA